MELMLKCVRGGRVDCEHDRVEGNKGSRGFGIEERNRRQLEMEVG